MKHRKLFPGSTTNQTPVCPYGCDPYSDTYAMPPLPPPPPPPLSSPPSTNHAQNVPPYVVIIIATSLGVACLIVIYYLLIARNCAGFNIFRPRRRQQHREDTQEDLLDDENRGPATIDHPIWYIRTVGLQPSIINSIAVFKYKKGDSLIEGTDCSICLNEFQDDEILRLLPKCDHAFHIPCIDTWLRSHRNCPVCRSGIISTSMTAPVAPNGSYYSNASRDEIGNNRVQDTESSTRDGGLSNNLARNSELEQNRIRTREESEFPPVDNEVQEYDASWVIDEDSDENDMVQDEIQQMRRSISADSLLVAMIEDNPVDRNGNAHKFEPGENNFSKSKTPMIDSDGANASSHPGSVSMMRSLSCGGRSFFSRHSRSLSSILPL